MDGYMASVAKSNQVPGEVIGCELPALAIYGDYVVDFHPRPWMRAADIWDITLMHTTVSASVVVALNTPALSTAPVKVSVILLHVSVAVSPQFTLQFSPTPKAHARSFITG